MASTFSPNYGLELIGTGEQQGVWGITTNETYKRVEQMIGAHAELDIDALPSASTLSGTDPEVLNWITTQTAPAGADNSEGRCPCVTITSSDDVGENNLDVKVFGTSISHNPDRLFVVNNQLSDSRSLKIISGNGGGGTVTVPNGKSAMVYTKGSANKAVNVLENYSLASLDFTVDGDGEIIIDDSDAAALVIKDSAGVAYQTFNTTAGKIVLEQDTETASGKDLATTGTGTITSDGLLTASNGLTVTAGGIALDSAASSVTIVDANAAALDVSDAGGSYLKFDTTTDAEKLIIGEETSDLEILDIDTSTVDVATQATSITVKDEEAAALDIKESSDSYIKLNTVGSGSVVASKSLETNEGIVVPTGKTIDIFGGEDAIISTDTTDAMDVFAHASRHAIGGNDELGSFQIQGVSSTYHDASISFTLSAQDLVSLTFSFGSRGGNSTVLMMCGCSMFAPGNKGFATTTFNILDNGSSLGTDGSNLSMIMGPGEDGKARSGVTMVQKLTLSAASHVIKLQKTVSNINQGAGLITPSTDSHFMIALDLGENPS